MAWMAVDVERLAREDSHRVRLVRFCDGDDMGEEGGYFSFCTGVERSRCAVLRVPQMQEALISQSLLRRVAGTGLEPATFGL